MSSQSGFQDITMLKEPNLLIIYPKSTFRAEERLFLSIYFQATARSSDLWLRMMKQNFF